MPKTALVVSGGGSKGAFSVGAIKRLLEKGFNFDLISGTSTGALIAPMVAIGDIEKLEEIYTSVSDKDILRHNWRKLYWNAIYDTKPLEKLIRATIDAEDRYNRIKTSNVTVLLCAVDLNTEATTYFTQKCNIPNTIQVDDKDEFVSAILASTNQPVFTPAIKIRKHSYVDGGVREIIPLEAVLSLGYERVVVISNSPGTPEIVDSKFNNALSIGMRTLSVMSSEIAEGDIDNIIEYNELLKYVEEVREKSSTILNKEQRDKFFAGGEKFGKAVDITLIRPKEPLEMDGLKFDPEKMKNAFDIGYKRAQEVLDS